MSKNKKQQKKEPKEEKQASWSDRIPRWGWVLIFLVPLVLSEFMFYTVGRRVSMILFPIAWIGFWGALMWRSGWSILKERDD
ncbi:MAG: hypothetical protein J7M17_02380 [Anaerolineae bacterium]|nr:hypothetical protein [Anaerolineae bacterium]